MTIWARISYQSGDDKKSLEIKVKTQKEFMAKCVENGIHPSNFLTCLISRGKGFSPVSRIRFNEWYYHEMGGD